MVKTFYVGAKGVVRVGDSCLVLKAGTGATAYWDIPGGRVDSIETLEEALNREIKEELPTIGDFSVDRMIGAYRLERDLPDGHGLILIFHKLLAKPFEVQLSPEHSNYRWVTQETVAELLTSGTKIEPGYYDALVKALS